MKRFYFRSLSGIVSYCVDNLLRAFGRSIRKIDLRTMEYSKRPRIAKIDVPKPILKV